MKQTSSAAVEFSWKQFWVSLVYENLPPVIFSPFAALLVERSFARAWNVCQNRNLLIAPSHNNPPLFCSFLLANYLSRLLVDYMRTADGDGI